MIRNLFSLLTNNIIINNIAVIFGFDSFLNSKQGIYQRIRIDKNLSVDKMAGFIENADVSEARNKTKNDLRRIIVEKLSPGSSLLDIGCGAGAFLKEYS